MVEERFLQQVQGGKQHVIFAGLLAMAHEQKFKGIHTEVVAYEVGDDGNFVWALYKAVTTDKDGREFTGYGDATPGNVSRGIKPHTNRMAETRAKARALRDMLNIEEAAYEEMLDGEPDATPPARSTGQGRSWQNQKKEEDRPPAQQRSQPSDPPEPSDKPATNSQRLKLADRIGRANRKVEDFEAFIGTSIGDIDEARCLYWIVWLEERTK